MQVRPLIRILTQKKMKKRRKNKAKEEKKEESKLLTNIDRANEIYS